LQGDEFKQFQSRPHPKGGPFKLGVIFKRNEYKSDVGGKFEAQSSTIIKWGNIQRIVPNLSKGNWNPR
jgi:hypothetical protein